ncbi:MAG: VOC family protein, partial [Gammaproteobacteria bacterium]
MPEDRLGHVGLTVSNLDEMLAFFTGRLGFAVTKASISS